MTKKYLIQFAVVCLVGFLLGLCSAAYWLGLGPYFMRLSTEDKLDLICIVLPDLAGGTAPGDDVLNETNERELPRDRLYDDRPFGEHCAARDIYEAGRSVAKQPFTSQGLAGLRQALFAR